MSTFEKVKKGMLAPFTSCRIILDHPQLLILMSLSVVFLYPRGVFNALKLVKMFILIFLDLALAHCIIDALEGRTVDIKRGVMHVAWQWKEAMCLYVLYLGLDYVLFHFPLFHATPYYTLLDGLFDHMLPMVLLLFIMMLASMRKPNPVTVEQGWNNLVENRYELLGFCLTLLVVMAMLVGFFPAGHEHQLLFGTAYIALLLVTTFFHRIVIMTFGLRIWRREELGFSYAKRDTSVPEPAPRVAKKRQKRV